LYGTDFANNTNNFTNIEQLDSDGDGFTNIVEIHARSFPGNASDFPVNPTVNSTLYGVEFYASNCQSCHNTLASSTMLGRTAAQIKIAINTEPAMSSLSTLSLGKIQAIASALASPTSAQGTTLDGKTLYSSNCAGCHRPLATSAKLGRTATQIQNSISAVSSMGFLSSLSPDQIQDIATTLAATPTPIPATILDGTALYAGNCEGCHNPLASTTKPGRTAAQIQNSITTVSVMNSLSLTSEQLQAILMDRRVALRAGEGGCGMAAAEQHDAFAHARSLHLALDGVGDVDELRRARGRHRNLAQRNHDDTSVEGG